MRLIDADAVLDRYYAEYEAQDICDGDEDRDWLKKCLDDAPTIDPESLRPQGRWNIKYDEYDCEYAVCSCCGAEFYALDEDTIDITYNYCPDCGAKMKGGTA